MHRLFCIITLFLNCFFLTLNATAAGFEWRETRWGSGGKLPAEKLVLLTSKNTNVVSLLGAYKATNNLENYISAMHAAGFKVAAGGHSYSALGGCAKAWECLDAYLTGLKAWANGPAKDADYIMLWPDDGHKSDYTGHVDDIWNVFLAAQKALPGRVFVGLAYSVYSTPPSFRLPNNTLVEVAPWNRLGCVPLSEQPFWAQTLQAWTKVGVRPILFDYGNRKIWQKEHMNVWCPSVQQADAKFVYRIRI